MKDLRKQVEENYQKWQKYKETVDPGKAAIVALRSQNIEKCYRNLQENWNEKHATNLIHYIERKLRDT